MSKSKPRADTKKGSEEPKKYPFIHDATPETLALPAEVKATLMRAALDRAKEQLGTFGLKQDDGFDMQLAGYVVGKYFEHRTTDQLQIVGARALAAISYLEGDEPSLFDQMTVEHGVEGLQRHLGKAAGLEAAKRIYAMVDQVLDEHLGKTR